MTLLLEEPTAADEQRAHLLFKEARQRRRRLRIIWIAIVTTVVVSLVSLGLTSISGRVRSRDRLRSTRSPDGPRISAPGPRLSMPSTTFESLTRTLARSRVLPLASPSGGSGDLGMVSIGNSLVLNRGDTAWLYSPGIDSAPADLGPSDGVFRGPSSAEAWIWSQPCAPILGCTNYNAPQMGSVQLIDSTGRKIGGPVTLPGDAGWYPTGLAGTAGIVLSELPTYGRSRQRRRNLESADQPGSPSLCQFLCDRRQRQPDRLGGGSTVLHHRLFGARSQCPNRV